jgi:hypothetical protein
MVRVLQLSLTYFLKPVAVFRKCKCKFHICQNYLENYEGDNTKDCEHVAWGEHIEDVGVHMRIRLKRILMK